MEGASLELISSFRTADPFSEAPEKEVELIDEQRALRGEVRFF